MPVFPIETLLLVRDLPSGDVLSIPVGDLALGCLGEEDEAELEQRTFLTEHLAQSPPEVVARFSLPEGTRLHTTDVLVPRPDLPRLNRIETPISITTVVLPSFVPPGEPAKGEAWCVIVPLGHAFFLNAGEELDEVVGAEVCRLVAASERSPRDYLDLLPFDGDRLEPIEVVVQRGEDGPAGRAASLRKAVLAHEKRKAAVRVLESIATPLHVAWESDKDAGRPLLARDDELVLLAGMLCGRERLSALIVGEARVGKTAVLRALWEREHEKGNTLLVYGTSGAELIAGMSGLGQWQERVRRVMDAAETLDAILFFDDLGDLFAEHGDSAIDVAGALKPWLEDGRVRLVGELHPERVDWVQARNPAFFACLNRVRLEPLGARDALAVLRAHVAFDRRRHPDRHTLADDAASTVVDLAERYMPYQSFPGKAVSLYRQLLTARAMETTDASRAVTARDVFEAVSLRTGVPVFLLREDRSLELDDVVRALGSRLLGQQAAVLAVAETLCVVKARLQPPNKPLASLLFVGPTGVGKTELARGLATYLFGSESRLVRIDMSEYMDASAAERLIRGTDRREGYLTRKVRQQPFCIVLLDEIEKAHPAVFDLLLQVCGEGRLTDARGKTASFVNTMVIMTSNLGARSRPRAGLGLGAAAPDDAAHYDRAVRETFRPELVNRLDRVVVFRSLGPVEARGVVGLALDKLRARRGLTEAGVDLDVTDDAMDRLAEGGFSEAWGARSVRRWIEDHVATPLASMLAEHGALAHRGRAVVTVEGDEPAVAPGMITLATATSGGVTIRLDRRLRSGAVRDLDGMTAISFVRRELQGHLRLPAIDALREKVRFLVTQLAAEAEAQRKRATSKRKGPPPTPPADMGRLLSEHHRLNKALEPLDASWADILGLEELAMTALFEGESLKELAKEAHAARRSVRPKLARALVSMAPARDGIVLLLHELDGGRAFDHWLAPMLRDLGRRGWTADVHLPDDRAENWPPERRFGPARPHSLFFDRLGGRGERPRSVVVSVRGEHAGVFLALEAGLHKLSKISARVDEALLFVELLAMRSSLSPAEWEHDRVVPIVPQEVEKKRRATPVRRLDAAEDKLAILDGSRVLDLPLAEYWPRFEEVVLEHLLALAAQGTLDAGTGSGDGFGGSFDEVRELAVAGQVIQAIKLYREMTGSSLVDARDAVMAMKGE